MGPCTRRTLLAAALTAPTLAACGTHALDPGTLPDIGTAGDDLTDAADGPLHGRRSATGQRWVATAGSAPVPTITDGAIGAPPGYRPGTDGDPDAGYATLRLDRPVTRIGARFRFDPSEATTTGLAIGAFTRTPGAPVDRLGLDAASPIHLAITPELIQFSVFAQGAWIDYTTLSADGRRGRSARFPTPLRCDGTTSYRADVLTSGDTARVRVPGLPVLTYRDPRIAAVAAPVAFWEYYARPGGTNLPRFVRVWAD